MRNYRLAYDASWAGPNGIGRVLDSILQRAPSHVSLVPVRTGKSNATPLTPVDLAVELARIDADVFWSPGFMPPLIRPKIPTLVTLHDLTHLHHYGLKHRVYYNALIRRLIINCTKVITVSDFTKQELHHWAGLQATKVHKIYNGVDSNFTVTGTCFSIGRPYLLYVGNRRKYKNIERLFRSYALSNLKDNGYCLALTGSQDQQTFSLESELKLHGSVHYLGFVPDEMLPSVYRGAEAVVFVSLYEGFGLPIIESMACGTPVITSNLTSMPEVAGNAAYLVDPYDIDSMAKGITEVIFNDELRASLIRLGLKRASSFNWDKSASDYFSLFESILPGF